MNTKRLFVAIKICANEDLHAFVGQLQQQLLAEKIRWVVPENLHITLQFLGNVPVEKIESICSDLAAMAAQQAAFDLNVSGCGVFPATGAPTVLWLGVVAPDTLGGLQKATVQTMQTHGFEAETRNFSPHLTLARFAKINNTAMLKTIMDKTANQLFLTTEVTDIRLYESVLTPQGSQYSVVRQFGLSGH